MAILRGLDGRFFDVPDDQVDRFAIPEEQVEQRFGTAGAALPVPSPAPPPPEAEVIPHHWHNHHWHNHHWHNHHWHNHHSG